MKSTNEQLQDKVSNLEEVLGTLVFWLRRELGEVAMRKLLNQLHERKS